MQFINPPTVCTGLQFCNFREASSVETSRERIDDFLADSKRRQPLSDHALVFAITIDRQSNTRTALEQIGFERGKEFVKTKCEDQRHKETGGLVIHTIHAYDLHEYREKLIKERKGQKKVDERRRFGNRPMARNRPGYLWATVRNLNVFCQEDGVTGTRFGTMNFNSGTVHWRRFCERCGLDLSQRNEISRIGMANNRTINEVMERMRRMQLRNRDRSAYTS